ncbi:MULTISPECIES: group II intron reverse transcriptase/maturase [Enterobacteriaceae]|uniref:group II intron reverse transcriptase/maturase n=1 Tax=Enterobacteriaceae TaxID=543 RepID=UPI000B4021BB|nr:MULTISPECIES: group II intron reverse transcriptase/maturase [Enterobacteriaceae]MBD3695535.1 group II intron reverse transcriptase/maturase [Klebsiella pneumoniae]MCZ9381339.1 group II intron reverse transcriptase/maturase [Klebsiella pneumoniae]OVH09373.1 group II intron reverse transcriptase/maturase [Klebsiella pneumoniae]OVH13196.1 group II intron reverse transcriptase/maturase [Klebsiella pneumoniae]HBY1214621.1 group II intron reverse transcriptase/maturase [Klebsiella pneumoniae]
MTTQKSCAGAPSHITVTWHSIDCAQCHREVRRLQTRIVKATQEGRWGKVKALQRLLTHSFSGKALAVRRVTENQGKKTPGVDKITWSNPEAKGNAVQSLRRHAYKPLPLRRLMIPKTNGKLRPLGIPTMKDRAMQALHLLALEPISETTGDRNSYGFRPGRSTADAVEYCFKVLARKECAHWVLDADIAGCFDNIDHGWLLANIPMDRGVLSKWLKSGFIDKGGFFPTKAGTPQGGIISPVLANMTLDGLQRELMAAFPQSKLAGRSPKVNLIRYADDFVITGITQELLRDKVVPLVTQFLEKRGLWLSPEKTRIVHISEGFDFLGQHFRKYNGKLIIKPSAKSVSTFLEKVKSAVTVHRASKQIDLIRTLNPVINGWAMYHRHICATETFQTVDHRVWQYLWHWAKRRHPKRGLKWVKARYFHQRKARDWMFADTRNVLPTGFTPTLALASSVKIARHSMISAAANPFDPKWESYFEARLGFKMANQLRGRKILMGLWLEQDGFCTICKTKITKTTGWHVHHIRRRIDGGSDAQSNLVLLHPNCHNQVHSLGIKLVKLARESGL